MILLVNTTVTQSINSLSTGKMGNQDWLPGGIAFHWKHVVVPFSGTNTRYLH